jgi:hypothetical protein
MSGLARRTPLLRGNLKHESHILEGHPSIDIWEELKRPPVPVLRMSPRNTPIGDSGEGPGQTHLARPLQSKYLQKGCNSLKSRESTCCRSFSP